MSKLIAECPVCHGELKICALKCADCGLTGYKNFIKDAKNPIEKTIEYWNTRVPATVNKDKFDPHNTVVGERLDAGCTD